ncbi:MAG: AEC family transporter [Chitinophagales bacterium]|nr:AEC family transporter [Chitinophagales bacterium]
MLHQSLPFLLFCLGLGFAMQKWNLFPSITFRKVNKVIINLTIPAITLAKISQLEMEYQYLVPTISGWLLFILGAIFFALLAPVFKWDKKTWAALTIGCGLGNTSFVGYPVTELMFGSEGLKYAIFVDQPGTFACLSTLGIAVAAYGSSQKLTVQSMLWKLLTFPAFPCFIIALLIPSAYFRLHLLNGVTLLEIFDYIGGWTNPLAFLSIGMQFTFSFMNVGKSQFMWGLIFKMALAPVLFLLTFRLLGWEGMLYDVTVLELAMPPMITASIIAMEYNLRPKLSLALVNYGMPLSAITLYLWSKVLM